MTVKVCGCLWVWVVLVGVVRGRVEISYAQDGLPVTRSFEDACIPFRGSYVERPVSGLLTTDATPTSHHFNLNLSSRGVPYILLCNVSIENLGVFKTCSDEIAQNASAVIGYPPYNPKYPGRSYFLFVTPPLMAPMVEINSADYLFLIQKAILSNWTLNVTVYPNHHNPWMVAASNPAFIAAQVTISLESLLVVLASIYCLSRIPRQDTIVLSHVVLTLEIISNLIRLLYFSVDPFFAHFIYPYELSMVFETITIPFSLSTSLLIGLFWFGMINKRRLHKGGLMDDKLRVPCYFMIGLVFAIEIACDIVRIIQGTSTAFTQFFVKLNGVIVFVTVLIIFGFYIFTGYRLVHTLKKSKTKSHVMLKIRNLLVALLLIVFLVFLVCIGEITPFYDTIYGYFCIWYIGHFAFGLLSAVHVAAFWPKPKGMRSTASFSRKRSASRTHSVRHTSME